MSWDVIKLADYPLWVRMLGVIWLIATCALSCALIFVKPTPQAKAETLPALIQSAASTGHNSPIVQTGANSHVTMHIGDKKNVARPWITIQKVDLPFRAVRVGMPLRIRILFKNTGASPARNVRNQCVAESMLAGQKPAYNYDRWPSVSSAVLGVGVEMEAIVSATAKNPLGQDGLDQLLRKDAVVYAHGHITYEDNSGSPHWTDFCYLLRAEPNGDYAWETFSEHNDVDTD